MMVRVLRIGFIGAAVLLAATAGPARAGFTTTASLDGLQEVPPVATPGSGFATVVYDDAAMTLTVTVEFQDLIGTSTVAHIHFGPPGVAGPTIVDLAGFPVGLTSGVYMAVLDETNFIPRPAIGIDTFADAIAAIRSGDTYVNVHSTFAPPGEIRGQLAAVPAPPAVVLAAVGGLGLLAGRVRRRLVRAYVTRPGR
jgi:hypothetical protein